MGIIIGNRNNGMIWNNSPLTIRYFVYSSLDKPISIIKKLDIAPNIVAQVASASVKISGFQKKTDIQIKPQYVKSEIQVKPGKKSTVGLNNMTFHSFTLTILVQNKDNVGVILQGVIVRAEKDMCLKIQYDLSYSDMTLKQIERQYSHYLGLNPKPANKTGSGGNDSDNEQQDENNEAFHKLNQIKQILEYNFKTEEQLSKAIEQSLKETNPEQSNEQKESPVEIKNQANNTKEEKEDNEEVSLVKNEIGQLKITENAKE